MGELQKVSFDLTGRAAVVTGGSQGLGEAMAMGLAAHGAKVAICARTVSKVEAAVEKIRAAGGTAIGLQLDITDQDGVRKVMDEVSREFGSLDILVNNAGVMSRIPVKDAPLEEWRQVVDTNLTGTFLCTQAAGRHMIAAGWGRIINITSLWGEHVYEDRAIYGMTKSGLSHFTRVLAREWGRHGITVNAIGPGVMITEMSRPTLSNAQAAAPMLAHISVGRAGAPEELNGALIMLCSDAGSYITGQTILVDGGYF